VIGSPSFKERGLATKKQGGEGQRERPRMKSSHEKLVPAEGGRRTRPGRARTVRRAPEGGGRNATGRTPEGGGRNATVRNPARGQGPKKARPQQEPESEPTAAWSVAGDAARETATMVAVAAIEKKAVGLEILDVAGKVDYADFLVIMTGRSDRHAQALAQGIEEALRKKGVRPVAVEGLTHASWVLMDFGDVVVHVFQDEARQLYDIEGLWLDARRLPVPFTPSE
jgi:ribosome-associated protein